MHHPDRQMSIPGEVSVIASRFQGKTTQYSRPNQLSLSRQGRGAQDSSEAAGMSCLGELSDFAPLPAISAGCASI